MPIVDSRGRLFGAINLIDLGVLLFVALLIPLGYGAYLLVHTPPPRVIAVTPNSLPFVRATEQRVQVRGQYLRPFLRARLGASTATFVLQTADAAEMRFSDMAPGTYDVILLDESQEIARLPGAVTILPPPVRALGWFVGNAGTDTRLVPGVKWGPANGPMVELLTMERGQDPARRPATLRVTCQWSAADQTCLAVGSAVRKGAELNLTVPGTTTRLTFFVNELRVDTAWLTVKVRFLGLSDALDKLRAGDVDTSQLDTSAATAGSPVPGVTAGALLMSLGERQKNLGSYTITATRVQPGAALNAFNVLSATVPVDGESAELLIPVESLPAGLTYRGVAIRPGNVFAFETKDYRVEALVVSISGS